MDMIPQVHNTSEKLGMAAQIIYAAILSWIFHPQLDR